MTSLFSSVAMSGSTEYLKGPVTFRLSPSEISEMASGAKSEGKKAPKAKSKAGSAKTKRSAKLQGRQLKGSKCSKSSGGRRGGKAQGEGRGEKTRKPQCKAKASAGQGSREGSEGGSGDIEESGEGVGQCSGSKDSKGGNGQGKDRELGRECFLVTPVPPPIPDLEPGPLPAGPGNLRQFLGRLLRRLGADEASALRQFVANGCFSAFNEFLVPEDRKPMISASSTCAGTDSPALVLKALAGAMADVLGVNVVVSCPWFCEVNPQKRSFLMQMFPEAKHAFADVADLGYPKALCYKSEKYVIIPPTDVGFGGFPCQDASRLNKHASSQRNKSMVAENDGRTGSVFQHIRKYLEQTPANKVYFFENVSALASRPWHKSNLAAVLQAMRDCGRPTKAFDVCPTMFGVPQTRRRIWMASVSRSLIDQLKTTEEKLFSSMTSLLTRFTGHHLTPLEDVLLEETSPEVLQHLASISQQMCGPQDPRPLTWRRW